MEASRNSPSGLRVWGLGAEGLRLKLFSGLGFRMPLVTGLFLAGSVLGFGIKGFVRIWDLRLMNINHALPIIRNIP